MIDFFCYKIWFIAAKAIVANRYEQKPLPEQMYNRHKPFQSAPVACRRIDTQIHALMRNDTF